MKALVPLLLAASAWRLGAAEDRAEDPNPISKVLQLLSELQSKIVANGEEATRLYEEFADFCQTRSKDLNFEISNSKSEAAELEAAISKETALIGSFNTKIEELTASIATNEQDAREASDVRKKEASDFVAEEKELTEVISSLNRAIGILERESQSGGASMMQVQNMGNVAQALASMVQASALSTEDGTRLAALVQTVQGEEEDDGAEGIDAPAAAAYQGHSGDIIETLDNLLEKATAQLSKIRGSETTALHNYEMLAQAQGEEVATAKQDLDLSRRKLAESSENKATAQGDLALTAKDLQTDLSSLNDLHRECLAKAQDFEVLTQARDEELHALFEAEKLIKEKTSGAEKFQYGGGAASFLQITGEGSLSSADVAKTVRRVRELAREHKSAVLAQLASRMNVALRSATRQGKNPFVKVKGLINDMITRLEEEAGVEATAKAHCDKELSETKAKQEDKNTDIAKLSTKIDAMTATSAQLKSQVAELQKGLSELASSQAEMDKMRKIEHSDFVHNKKVTSQGLEAVKMSLKVLRDYYLKKEGSNEGAGTGIIGLLEVVESDLSKSLAGLDATEESAAAAYQTETNDNQVERARKEQDVKAKTKEASALDKAVTEASTDLTGVQAELAAVEEYLASLQKQCVAQPETYEARKARRDAELSGLKEAEQAIEGQTVFLQVQHGSRRTLRRR